MELWDSFVGHMTKAWSFSFKWAWGDHAPIDMSFGGSTWMLYAGGIGVLMFMGILPSA